MVQIRNTHFLSNTVFEKKYVTHRFLTHPPPQKNTKNIKKKKIKKLLTFLRIELVSFLNKLLDVKRH